MFSLSLLELSVEEVRGEGVGRGCSVMINRDLSAISHVRSINSCSRGSSKRKRPVNVP